MFLDIMVATLNHSIHRYPDVLNYLTSRGATTDDINKYKLGYSRFVNVPEEEGRDRERFMKEAWKGKKFENKVIFPVMNSIGHVAAIIGRSYVGEKDFKAFQTEEAEFSGWFLGLPQALPHIYRTNRVFVVEGPFDLIAVQHVLPNTVCSLTAGLYKNQKEILRLYCDNIVTIFDSDEAGREASDKLDRDKDVITMELGYKDPSECLKQLGLSSFKRFLEKKVSSAVPLF